MKHLASGAALAALLSACVAVRQDPRDARVEHGLLSPVVIEGEPAWTIEERMRHHGVPGVQVAVIDGFQIAWSKAWGSANARTGAPVTSETLFQASSMSKPVAAALALALAEQGRISLERDVNDELRSWKLPESESTLGSPVTLERILCHAAGLSVPGSPGFEPGEPRPALRQELDGIPPANTRPVRAEFAQGELRYSGGGYMVLQQLLEDVTGQPFAELARERVLRPLGMQQSTFAQPLPEDLAARAAAGHDEHGVPLPGGWRVHVDLCAAGLWTTAEEYARFVVDLQRALAGKPGVLLSTPMARRMIERRTSQTGLGVFLLPHGSTTWLGHGGANWGYNSVFVAHPGTGQGVVVLCNSDDGEPLCWELVRAVSRAYAWDDYLPAVLARAAVRSEDIERLEGRYLLDADDVLAVERRGDRLNARTTLDDPFELIAVSGGFFARSDLDREHRFALGPDGRAASVEQRWSGEAWESPKNRLAADKLVPSELLERGRTDEALQRLVALRTAAPQDPALERRRLEARGRALLARGTPQAAAALLRFAIETYPGFASTLDALAGAQFALGDAATARDASEQVLRALETDFTATASWRVVYRKRALERLAGLGP